jgi:hypothetical protein
VDVTMEAMSGCLNETVFDFKLMLIIDTELNLS